MFDFERLELYQITRAQNKAVLQLIFGPNQLDNYIKEEWKRASLSMLLNLTEGAGRITDEGKKQYFTMARGSVYESTALLQLVFDLGQIEEKKYNELYATYEQISKMLLGMYRSKNN